MKQYGTVTSRETGNLSTQAHAHPHDIMGCGSVLGLARNGCSRLGVRDGRQRRTWYVPDFIAPLP